MNKDKTAVLSVGGVTYPAKYTFQSYVDMHEKHGVNVFDLDTPNPKHSSILTWGAIVHAAPTITPEEITKQVSLAEGMTNLRTCVRVIRDSMPKEEDADKDST